MSDDKVTHPDHGSAADGPMDSVDEHLARVLESIGVLAPISRPLLEAQGLLLAENVFAEVNLPGFDNSAMDGYAVRAVDVRAATADDPVELSVVGDIAAGARSISGMGPHLAMRIMTGAPMPSGADAVVPIESTDGGMAKVQIRASAQSGQYVRRAGEDLQAGALALAVGAPLGPQQIALLAAVGKRDVHVLPRPRVGIISTGNELVEVGQTPGFGQVTDVNSFLLAAAASDAGAEVYRVGIVPDDHDRLIDTLEGLVRRVDIIITTGGVSMGAYDVVKEALGGIGSVRFTRVAMQPGMPQGYGHLGEGEHETPIFCLPGNPVSSIVSFEAFVRPAIRKLLGKRNLHRASVQAIALERMDSPAGKRQYRRGLLHREADGSLSVEPIGGAGSHLIAALAASNCLIVIDEAVTEVVPGSRLTVIPQLLAQR
ncbi:MAG: molybdopterin molybdochelatase [Pseudonocardiales bacterium]|nr:molybdopterin molybdochelatase [Jatrophihabitantaceae bacterium]MCW2603894.1 molybdopterin molybdochelatase [Pseudonocardiales bacterium]